MKLKTLKLLGFIIRSVIMGMIAALFLFIFFPHLMEPVVDNKGIVQEVEKPLSFAGAVKRASPSVVNIRTLFPDPERENAPATARLGVGSGIIISAQGYVVTNYHVIFQAKGIAVQLTDGRSTIAKVIGFDADTDLAVLKIAMDNMTAFTMDSTVEVEVGDIALVIGNPFGVGQAITMGIVSATGRRFLGLSEYENFIQTDAAVNPGNSGGALINTKGELLGISSAYFTTGTKTGISYAIPTALVMDVSEAIISQGRVVRGWLGFSGGPLNKAGRDEYGEEAYEEFGAEAYLIKSISPGGPAEIAGLKKNDVILRVNEIPLGPDLDLRSLIASSSPGTKIVFEVRREKQTLHLTAIVKERPQPGST